MKKGYEVVGDAIVHGFRKGEKFVADLFDHEEHLLLVAGHIRVVPEEKPAPKAALRAKKSK